MATSVCYQNCQLSTFINKISRSAYILPFDAPEMYLGFAYQRVSVDSYTGQFVQLLKKEVTIFQVLFNT